MTRAESDLERAEAALERRCEEARLAWRTRGPQRRAAVRRAVLALRMAAGAMMQARRQAQLEAVR